MYRKFVFSRFEVEQSKICSLKNPMQEYIHVIMNGDLNTIMFGDLNAMYSC